MKFTCFFITLALIGSFSVSIFGQSFAQVTWNTFQEKDGLFTIQIPSNWNASELTGTEALAPIDYMFRYNDKGNSFAWVEVMISEPLYSNSRAALESYMSDYQQYDDFNLLEPIECNTYTLKDEPACSFLSSQQLEGEQRRNVLNVVSVTQDGIQTDVVFVASSNIYEPFLPVAEYIVDSITINSTAVKQVLENQSIENIESEIPLIPTENEPVLQSEIPVIPKEDDSSLIESNTSILPTKNDTTIQNESFRSVFDTFVTSDPGGFGVYDKKATNTFKPGEDIILYIEPAGFEYNMKTDDRNKTLYTINFSADFTISDTEGKELTGQEGLPVSEIVSHHQNKEVFIPFTITQTTPFPTGNYVIKYTIHDTNSGDSFDIVKEIVISDTIGTPSQSESNMSPSTTKPTQKPITSPSLLSQEARDIMLICSSIEIALYNPCSELINSDGSLTYKGQSTFKCIFSGSVLGLLGSTIIPPDLLLEGLDILSKPTGCAGLVKIDMLKSIVGIDNILVQLRNILG
jgi:hypothetical protein